jgi:hypothetical protein
MISLLQNIDTVVTELTAGLTFLRESSGSQVAISSHLNAFPERKLTELAPFCLIHPGKGAIGRERTRRVAVKFCLYQPDRALALTELGTLITALWPLSHPGRWTPWVQNGFTDSFGDDDTGLQPHPLYFYEITLDFFAALLVPHSPWRP